MLLMFNVYIMKNLKSHSNLNTLIFLQDKKRSAWESLIIFCSRVSPIFLQEILIKLKIKRLEK
ncbi:hypothetical protein Syun_001420 [Stephania yunnanensis]|uniref:Uncharacterized protein n=1 Tax=Stephania yunnanensis TaxID=152371 RepID=A0AAP0LEP5_9MAGN